MDTRGLSKGVAKAINTMVKHKEYMLNAVKYEYSNGPLEGFNNKIKLLKLEFLMDTLALVISNYSF